MGDMVEGAGFGIRKDASRKDIRTGYSQVVHFPWQAAADRVPACGQHVPAGNVILVSGCIRKITPDIQIRTLHGCCPHDIILIGAELMPGGTIPAGDKISPGSAGVIEKTRQVEISSNRYDIPDIAVQTTAHIVPLRIAAAGIPHGQVIGSR